MVSFFWVSGVINSMLALYPKKNEVEKRELIFNTFVTLLGFSVLAGALMFVFSDNLLSFLDKKGNGSVIALSVFYLLINNPSFLIEYILFLNQRQKQLVTYSSVAGLFNVLAAFIPALLKCPIEYSMIGLIVIALCRLVFAVYLLKQYSTFKLRAHTQVQGLKLSLPIILSIFVSGSGEYLDGVIIKWKFDDLFFALYRYGAKELPIIFTLANTLSQAMTVSIAHNLEDGLAELKEKSAKLMHWFFPVTMVLMIISPYLYRFVFNESFLYSAIIFNIYLLLIIPRVLFPQTVLTGTGNTRFLLISSILEIIINVSLSIYLAGKLGLAGIAAGTFISSMFDKIFLALVNKFYFNIGLSKYVKIIPYFVYVILTFVAFGINQMLLKYY